MSPHEALQALAEETGLPLDVASKITERGGTIELDWDSLAGLAEWICEQPNHAAVRDWIDCLEPDDHTDHSDKRVCQGVGCPHGDH